MTKYRDESNTLPCIKRSTFYNAMRHSKNATVLLESESRKKHKRNES